MALFPKFGCYLFSFSLGYGFCMKDTRVRYTTICLRVTYISRVALFVPPTLVYCLESGGGPYQGN